MAKGFGKTAEQQALLALRAAIEVLAKEHRAFYLLIGELAADLKELKEALKK